MHPMMDGEEVNGWLRETRAAVQKGVKEKTLRKRELRVYMLLTRRPLGPLGPPYPPWCKEQLPA